MKKIIAFAILAILIAVPCLADTWTINFETQGDVSGLSLYYGEVTGDMTAAQFVNREDLTEIQLGITSPQEFTIPYADGVQYGVCAKVFDANGDSSFVMDPQDGNLSPIVWRATAIPEIVDAHYETVTPSVDGKNIINIIINQGR
jgi:hypothetical protein